FARRPWLDRAELLPHRISAEVEPRRGQRWIHVRGGKGEAAGRLDGVAGRAVSALVGWRALGRPWQRRRSRRAARGRCDLARRVGRGGCDLDRRIERERLAGLLLRKRWALLLLIRDDRSGRRRLEPVALERNQAVAVARDAVVALAAAVDHRTCIGTREKGLFTQEPLADRPGDARVVRIETDQLEVQWQRDGVARRARDAELGLVDGAERGSKRGLLGAVDHRLTREQGSEVLVSDLARQQQQHQDAEAEGGSQTALRPVARCTHQ